MKMDGATDALYRLRCVSVTTRYPDPINVDLFAEPVLELTVHDRIMDRLADILFTADDILDLVEGNASGELRRVGNEVRGVFERVNALMRRMAH